MDQKLQELRRAMDIEWTEQNIIGYTNALRRVVPDKEIKGKLYVKRDGSPVENYTGYGLSDYQKKQGFHIVSNRIFVDALKFERMDGHTYTGKAARMRFKSLTTGATYGITPPNVAALIPHIRTGIIIGRWKFLLKGYPNLKMLEVF